MSEASKDLVDSAEHNSVGPDYFSYYTHEVVELFSQEDILPSSSPTSKSGRKSFDLKGQDITELSVVSLPLASNDLFSNCIGPDLAVLKKERLKALLRQGVTVLSQEVNEMVDPVIAIHRLRLALKCKNYPSHLKGTSSDGDVGQDPCKKFKSSSSFSSTSLPVPESPNDPGSSGTIDHNLQFLLENDISQVEEVVTKYADELSETLGHMEHQLEKLLNSVMSQCRPMILKEKQQLQKMIQKLPSENLDRVAEIVQRNMPIDTQTSDEMYIDLDKESNMTLWRLYHYVEAVDKARELAL